MNAAPDFDRLPALIALIDRKVAELPPFDWEKVTGHEIAVKRIGDELVRREEAKLSNSGGAMMLTLAGVRASATSGLLGALKNWTEGARRRLREAGR